MGGCHYFIVLPLLSSRLQWEQGGGGGEGQKKKKGGEEERAEEAAVAVTNFASALSETSHTLVHGERKEC